MNIRTGNPAVDRALDEVRRDQSGTASFTAGTTKIMGTTFSPGIPKKVPHKLGRKAQGYVVIGCRSNSEYSVTDSHNTETDLDKYLTLTVFGAFVTLDLLVF